MSTKHRFTLSTLAALLLMSFVVGLYAKSDGSSIEIDNCIVLTNPGVYDVTIDLPGKDGLLSSGNCIELQASPIVLNLNDHSITGPGVGDGITDGGMPQSDITIRQGAITGFETAIDLSASNGNIVEYVRVSANSVDGISVGEQSVARFNVATENDRGLVMTCPANAIGNSAWDNTSNDFFLNDPHLCSLSEGLNSFGSSGGVGSSCASVGLSDCSDNCTNLLTDEANCGACGIACDPGELCINGSCALSCQTGLVDCANTCTDILKDEENCGACGNNCAGGEICMLGSCEGLITDCEIQAINPLAASQDDLPFSVAVYGEGFEPDSQVLFGGESCETNYVDKSHLTFTVPAGEAPGVHMVTVVNADSSSCSFSGFFVTEAVPPPVITQIFPVSAYQNDLPADIRVFGSGFDPESQMFFDGEPYETIFISQSELRFSIPAATSPGTYDITVVNLDGQGHTMPNAFEVLPDCPAITDINPTSAYLADFPVYVLVLGSGFESETQVLFGGEPYDTIVISSNALRFDLDLHAAIPAGTYDLEVVNPDGCSEILIDAFEVLEDEPLICPSISSTNPSFAYQHELPISIDVWGSGFDPGSLIIFNEESYPVTYISDSQLSFVLAAGAASGAYRITVVNPNGCSDVLMNAFVLE